MFVLLTVKNPDHVMIRKIIWNKAWYFTQIETRDVNPKQQLNFRRYKGYAHKWKEES